MGAPSYEVTEVIVAGQTHHAAIRAFFDALGVENFLAYSFAQSKRLRAAHDATRTTVTNSQLGQVTAALVKLRAAGRVVHDRDLGYWQVAPEHDE